jgi:hypothetical protein
LRPPSKTSDILNPNDWRKQANALILWTGPILGVSRATEKLSARPLG